MRKEIDIIEDAGYMFMGTEIFEGKTYYNFTPDNDEDRFCFTYGFTLQSMKKLIKENKLDFSQFHKEDE